MTIKPLKGKGRPVTVHASKIVPFAEPYLEPHEFDLELPVGEAPPPTAHAGHRVERKKRKVGN